LINKKNCYDLARRLKNIKLQLDCLLYLTKISQQVKQEASESAIRILRDAVEVHIYRCYWLIT